MGKRFFILILVWLLLVSAGCSTPTVGENARKLKIGYSRDYVISKLGEPDSIEWRGEYEVLRYRDRLLARGSAERADYVVTLRDGKVSMVQGWLDPAR